MSIYGKAFLESKDKSIIKNNFKSKKKRNLKFMI